MSALRRRPRTLGLHTPAAPPFAGTEGGRHEPRGPRGLELEPAADLRLLCLPRAELAAGLGVAPLPDAGQVALAAEPAPAPVPDSRVTRALRELTSAGEPVPVAALGRLRAEAVFGDDDRRRVERPGNYPWRAICHLRITAADGSILLGTGWLAAPRLVVTAGHCVFQHRRGGWADSIEVTPGRDGSDRAPFGTFVVGRSGLRSVEGWTRRADHDFDYGGIVLPRPRAGDPAPGDRAGFFGFAAPAPAALLQGPLNLAGYPDDLEPSETLWWHARSLDRVLANTLLYTIDTEGGQSGAPLWRLVGGDPQVVGIHSGEASRTNQAVRISGDVHFSLASWKQLAT